MRLITTTYTEQITRLPKIGRHIVAQFDDEGVVVYQAYRPAIGEFAITTQKQIADLTLEMRLGFANVDSSRFIKN